MQFHRRLTTAVTVALVALLSLAAAGTRADDFPSRIIRVVVAFPAGGPTDFVARILADRLKPLLGQNVIVENRPGANGGIGAEGFLIRPVGAATTLSAGNQLGDGPSSAMNAR